MRSTDSSTARPEHHRSSAAARRFAGTSSSLDGAAPAGAWESRTPHRRPAWPGAAEADPASSLALVVILAVIPQATTELNQTALTRIPAQPDLARPYWNGQSGIWAVTKEKAERWTRWRAFAQVRHGSNIQLLPFSLVSPKQVIRTGTASSWLTPALECESRPPGWRGAGSRQASSRSWPPALDPGGSTDHSAAWCNPDGTRRRCRRRVR